MAWRARVGARPPPSSQAPPTPTDRSPLTLRHCDEQATGTCGGSVGVGGEVDVGRGPRADP